MLTEGHRHRACGHGRVEPEQRQVRQVVERWHALSFSTTERKCASCRFAELHPLPFPERPVNGQYAQDHGLHPVASYEETAAADPP